MSKHTQGPWSIGMRNGANSNLVYAHDGADLHRDTSICSVYGMYQHCELHEQKDNTGLANARLIAAAPELLEALKMCAGFCAGEEMSKSGLIRALEKARSAIQKAEGTQP